jgi:hypothetical protein
MFCKYLPSRLDPLQHAIGSGFVVDRDATPNVDENLLQLETS